MAPRLPTPGADNGQWGAILNDYLSASHNSDGSLKPAAVSAAGGASGTLADESVTTAKLANGAVTNAKLDSATQTTLSSVASKYTLPGSGMPSTDMSATVQASLAKADSSVQNSPIVDIRNYGAVLDGTTDDTAAIQAALNACPEGGAVVHPGGTAIISAPLVMKDRTCFRGEHFTGATIKLKNNSPAVRCLVTTEAWTSGQTFVGLYVKVQNLYLDGNIANNAGSTTDGIVTMNWKTSVEHVEVWNCGGNGIRLTNVNSAGGMLSNTNNENRIERCTVTGNRNHGIFIEDTGNALTDGFLIDNVSYGNWEDQIHINNAAGWLIAGNHTYNGSSIGKNGLFLDKCFATRIVGNYIDGFGAATDTGTYYGMWAQVSGGTSRGTAISGNTITSNESVSGSTYRHLAITTPASAVANITLSGNIINGANGPLGVGLYAAAGSGGTLNIQDAGNRIFSMTTPLVTFSGVNLLTDSLQATASPTETYQDAAAALFTAGQHNGITFVYDDTNSRIDATVAPPTLIQSVTKTADYTLASEDAGYAIDFNSASPVTLTVPPNSDASFAIGAVIEMAQLGAGQLTIAPGAGVTLRTARSLTMRAQYSTARLRKLSASSGSAALPTSNLAFRLLADSISGANGDPVASWAEISGQGHPAAAQSNSSNRPTLVLNAVNGHKAVSFNGTSQFLALSGSALDVGRNSGAINVFIVYNYPIAYSGVRTALAISTGTSSTSSRCLVQKPASGVWSVGGRRLDADSASFINGSTVPIGAWGAVSARFVWSSSDLYQYLNGSLGGSSTSWLANGSTSDTAALSACVGANTAGTAEYFGGHIAEIIIYSADLNASQRATVHSYIQDTYNINVSDYSNTGDTWIVDGDLT